MPHASRADRSIHTVERDISDEQRDARSRRLVITTDNRGAAPHRDASLRSQMVTGVTATTRTTIDARGAMR
jgi:hypothetical protein